MDLLEFSEIDYLLEGMMMENRKKTPIARKSRKMKRSASRKSRKSRKASRKARTSRR